AETPRSAFAPQRGTSAETTSLPPAADVMPNSPMNFLADPHFGLAGSTAPSLTPTSLASGSFPPTDDPFGSGFAVDRDLIDEAIAHGEAKPNPLRVDRFGLDEQ